MIMSLDFKCEKCPKLKLSSKGQLKKHKDLHKTGLLEPGGDVEAAKKVSLGAKKVSLGDKVEYGTTLY